MKANEFVKKYGWDLSEMIVDKAQHIIKQAVTALRQVFGKV